MTRNKRSIHGEVLFVSAASVFGFLTRTEVRVLVTYNPM
jgi:hypothetical protein